MTNDTTAAATAETSTTDARRRRTPLVALFAAQLFSLSGNAIALIAIPIIALTETGSPLAAGVAGVFATVPLVIGGALGGVLVDRFGYRTSSIVADIASGVTVLAIPVLAATVGLHFGVLLALVFLGGLLDAPGDTAKTVLMPDLAALARVPLARAAGAQSTVQRTATMIGAGVAGALVALAGPMPALVVDAAGFAVSALLIVCFVPRRAAASPRPAHDGADGDTPVQGGFVAGIRFIAGAPLLRSIVLLVTLTNAIDAAGMTVLKPVYATQVLGDPAVLGFMVGCFAAGALTGSALFAAAGHRYSGRVVFALCFVLAGTPPYLAMALGAPVPVLLPILVFSGLAAGALNPMMATAMYGLVPDGMRARVFGAMTAGVAASMPLGAFLGGLSVERFGLAPTLLGCAIVYLVLGSSPLYLRSFSGLAAARTPTGVRGTNGSPG
ncbi:MFS transporter [Agromyces cerinus]|uniref:Transmembrane secretion effector n=1 Tax=Agromyces cerinus subsp. cerinus TaxID=232089 RepID=A0A1N6DDP8_9MICO|nr:MFS transporter [Agromyces cerinus]SIN68915.1 Transmembrane secretion effector [Agromyces cerinus subsp. cerinus]